MEYRYPPFLYGIHPGRNFRLYGYFRTYVNKVIGVWAYITLGDNPVLYGDFGIKLPKSAMQMDFPWVAGLTVITDDGSYECVGFIEGDRVTRIVPVQPNTDLVLNGGDKIQMFAMYQEA